MIVFLLLNVILVTLEVGDAVRVLRSLHVETKKHNAAMVEVLVFLQNLQMLDVYDIFFHDL